MANVHYLKTFTSSFKDAKKGIKQFEVRKNDRNYEIGDTLILEEINQNTERCTGAWVPKLVTYKDDTSFDGYVILGMVDIKF